MLMLADAEAVLGILQKVRFVSCDNNNKLYLYHGQRGKGQHESPHTHIFTCTLKNKINISEEYLTQWPFSKANTVLKMRRF
jgi:hypothetical protein